MRFANKPKGRFDTSSLKLKYNIEQSSTINYKTKIMKKLFFVIAVSLIILNNNFGQTWSVVGNGVNAEVNSFAVYNGELYVGGQFYNLNGSSSYGLMKWNGSTFDTLPGTNLLGTSRIEAMAVYNNELYVGGTFCTTSSCGPLISNFKYIARWNGTLWNSVGSGFDFKVFSMYVDNGYLYVGGVMNSTGSTIVNSIARWNGSQWQTLANGINTNNVREVFEFETYQDASQEELYIAGDFSSNIFGSSCIAKWNGATLNAVGTSGANGDIYALGKYNNVLYAGGCFTTIDGITVNGIAKWNGTSWSTVGNGITIPTDNIFALKEYHNELFAGGEFNSMNGMNIKGIARYNGTSWNSVGSGVDSTNIIVDTIINYPFDTIFVYAPHRINAFQEFNNELYVGGSFNMIGGITAHNIAKLSTPQKIEEVQSSSFISVFPNPASDKLTINVVNFSGKQLLQIYNYIGQLLYENLNYKGGIIDIQNMENGVYLLKYSDTKNNCTKKIIINH